jgi:secondary thiamine-phosphate synthase enzyme
MIYGKMLALSTRGFSEVHDLTHEVRQAVAEANVKEGIVNVFAIGSTASITSIEFEPALVRDLSEALDRLLPRDMPSHHSETWGDDNGFSHLRASFLGPGLTAPIHRGELLLGTWQQIVILDHDNRPRDRRVFVQVIGE